MLNPHPVASLLFFPGTRFRRRLSSSSDLFPQSCSLPVIRWWLACIVTCRCSSGHTRDPANAGWNSWTRVRCAVEVPGTGDWCDNCRAINRGEWGINQLCVIPPRPILSFPPRNSAPHAGHPRPQHWAFLPLTAREEVQDGRCPDCGCELASPFERYVATRWIWGVLSPVTLKRIFEENGGSFLIITFRSPFSHQILYVNRQRPA